MLMKYKEIFEECLGMMRELKCLESMGVLQPVKHSEWATPLVPVPKADGNVRL